MYKLLRSFLFLFDPEWVHYFSMNSLKLICMLPFGKSIIKKIFAPKKNIQYSKSDKNQANSGVTKVNFTMPSHPNQLV